MGRATLRHQVSHLRMCTTPSWKLGAASSFQHRQWYDTLILSRRSSHLLLAARHHDACLWYPGYACAHGSALHTSCACPQRDRQEAAIKAAWDAGNDFQLPMGRVDDALDTEGLQQASLEASIPSSNRGFQMLQKMGWSEGKGLGASEDGEFVVSRSPWICPTYSLD